MNRGFLYGPFCPIYGFGALGTVYLLQWVLQNVTTIFIAGVILTSSLEYFTSWRWRHYLKQVGGIIQIISSTLMEEFVF